MNYTLKNAHGIVGKISLFKPSYKLGEDVMGLVDLTGGTIACLQVITHTHMHTHTCTRTHTHTHAHTHTHTHTVISGPAVHRRSPQRGPPTINSSELRQFHSRPPHGVLPQYTAITVCTPCTSHCDTVISEHHRYCLRGCLIC